MNDQPNRQTIPVPIEFSVDSALLRELGERLVGKPHIALAELVKNSYDADATKVEINFAADSIHIWDNGHGMTEEEFKNFWMRIGSPHKQKEVLSRKYKRPVTGSKGVGRLAVQFLADYLELTTSSENDRNTQLIANVDWKKAVKAGELTKAQAIWQHTNLTAIFPGSKKHGTIIKLSSLHQQWSKDDLENLAKEIWALQPPFRSNPHLSKDKKIAFEVSLITPNKEDAEKFELQMKAGLDDWEAKISGKLISSKNLDKSMKSLSKVQISVNYRDGEKFLYEHEIENCKVYNVEFELRIYRLQGRQSSGIRVDEVREYMTKYGGVHVYDGGFHLPYYGPETDWLNIERDHALRKNRSDLLPDELQIKRGLQFLPSQRRIFGVVHISTSLEREMAIARNEIKALRSEDNSKKEKRTKSSNIEDAYLKIQVTRDRLIDNSAYQNLKEIVRVALDYYAVQTQRREEIKRNRKKDSEAKVESVSLTQKFELIENVLEYYEPQISDEIYSDLKQHIREAAEASESEAEKMLRRTTLLGSLATVGISALAYQHEIDKQLHLLRMLSEDITSIKVVDSEVQAKLDDISEGISNWLKRARATRSLFSFMMEEDNRSEVRRFKALALIKQIISQMGILLRGTKVELHEISYDLLLPPGTYAEWSSVFQNVLLNAVNAMLDFREKSIAISAMATGQKRILLVQDTGSGVDLTTADSLFEPFIRKLQISDENRALGLGGTGLGLTIVKMLASNLNCRVSFTRPNDDFKTAFQLSWTEKE